MAFCYCSMFCYVFLYSNLICNYVDGEERAGCFAYFVFLVSRDCCFALPRGAMGLSAVCNCIFLDDILLLFLQTVIGLTTKHSVCHNISMFNQST